MSNIPPRQIDREEEEMAVRHNGELTRLMIRQGNEANALGERHKKEQEHLAKKRADRAAAAAKKGK